MGLRHVGLLKNGKKMLLLAQELNPKIPSFTGHALIRDVTDIKAFIGLESDSDALLKLSSRFASTLASAACPSPCWFLMIRLLLHASLVLSPLYLWARSRMADSDHHPRSSILSIFSPW